MISNINCFGRGKCQTNQGKKYTDDKEGKHYEIYGLFFFGSATAFAEKFDKANDLDDVIIDFKGSRLNDISAIACVNTLSERYVKLGKPMHLRHLSEDGR